jgi:hypothetical protein
MFRPSKMTFIVFIGIKRHNVTSHWHDIFHCQDQSVDTDNITQWDQRKNIQFILTISPSEIKGRMSNLYWQYHPVRSKEEYPIYTDNITQWDQRKNIQFILTISPSEIKGRISNLPIIVYNLPTHCRKIFQCKNYW